MEKTKTFTKRSERISRRRGLEMGKELTGAWKEGTPGRRVHWSKDTTVGTCLPPARNSNRYRRQA